MKAQTDTEAALQRSWALRCALLAFVALALLALSLLVVLALVPAAGAASGDLAWSLVYNGTGNGVDTFVAARAAPNGGIYVAGNTFANNPDMVVARYDAAGNQRWLHTYNGPLDAGDAAIAAATDGSGNLVVVGRANDASIVAVVKYGPGGQRRWARTYDDPESADEAGTNVAIDGAGNIYVSGRTYTAATGDDWILIKYSPAGTRRWVRHFVGPVSTADDEPYDIAVDATGNVYVTGYSPGVATARDVVTMKYDPAGHRRWLRRWDGPLSGDDYGNAIAVNGDGTVYVAGQTTGISSGLDAVVLKYARNGTFRWSRSRTGLLPADDQYLDLTLLGNGDVVATGSLSVGRLGGVNVLLVRLSPGGQERWARTYNGPDGLTDVGRHVAHGPLGAVYVTGYSVSATTSYDILTLKYSASGALRWAKRYTSAGALGDFDGALVVGSASVYVAGWESAASVLDATLLRYRP